MSDLCFDFTNIPEELYQLYQEIEQQYWSRCEDERNIENLVKSYKFILISMVRFINSDIVDILEARGITDPATQQRINQHFIQHINENISSIIEPIINQYGVFSVDEHVIIVDFIKDYKIVSDYMSEVHAHALDATIFELGKAMESHINQDCEYLEEIYKIVKASKDEDDRKANVSEYINKNDKNLVEKYGPIILMMKDFGFKSNKFKETMSFFASNLSLEYKDIIRRYYKLSLPKDVNYKRNMKSVEDFISVYDNQVEAIKKHEQLVREECEKNKQEKYKSLIN